MSKLAYHADHYKSGQVLGLARHNWEKRGEHDQHSNQDINPKFSVLNVQLIEQERSLYREVKKTIDERCTGRVTAASNVITETIVYPPEDIWLDMNKTTEYFKDVLAWHQDKFGSANVKSAVIHYDETTPHMHTDVIPLTADGRLCSKEIFARKELFRHHTELAKYLQERGWNIERGEKSADKQIRSLSVPEYKKQAEEQKERLLQEIDDQRSEMRSLTFAQSRANSRLEKAKTELKDTREDLQSWQQDLQQTQQQLLQVNQELEKAQEDLQKKKEAIQNTQQELQNVTESIQRATVEQMDLLDQNERLQGKIEASEGRLEVIDRAIQDHTENARAIYGLSLDEKLERAQQAIDHDKRYHFLEALASKLDRFLERFPRVKEIWEKFEVRDKDRYQDRSR